MTRERKEITLLEKETIRDVAAEGKAIEKGKKFVDAASQKK